jgi:hypothetical protein
MKRRKSQNQEIVWITVMVQRGIPVCAKAFRTENAALAREKVWRKQISPDYDEIGVFDVSVTDK